MNTRTPPVALPIRALLPVAAGLLLSACGSDDPPPGTLGEATEAILAGAVRDTAGLPVPGAETEIGFQSTPTDLAGFVRYPEQLPGRLTIRAKSPGYTLSSAVTQLAVGSVGSAYLTLAPREETTDEASAPGPRGDDELVVTTPPGAWLLPDGSPATGPATFGWYRGGDADPVVPGTRTWLRADQYEEQLDAFAIFELAAPVQGDQELALADGAEHTLRWEVGADWPHADAEDLAVYAWDRIQGYWKKTRTVTVIDGVIEVPYAHVGWTAIGALTATTSCVTGRVEGPDGPVMGAEVTVAEQGRPGVERVITGSDGVFCAAVLPGAVGSVSVFGWNAKGSSVGSGASDFTAANDAAGCDAPSECTDVGALPVTWHYDRDRDAFYDGNGDCDDADLSDNPIDSGDSCF